MSLSLMMIYQSPVVATIDRDILSTLSMNRSNVLCVSLANGSLSRIYLNGQTLTLVNNHLYPKHISTTSRVKETPSQRALRQRKLRVLDHAEAERKYWPNPTNSLLLRYEFSHYVPTNNSTISPEAFTGICEGDCSFHTQNNSYGFSIHLNHRVDMALAHRLRDLLNSHLVGTPDALFRISQPSKGKLELTTSRKDTLILIIEIIKHHLVMPYRRMQCANACAAVGVSYNPLTDVVITSEWFVGMHLADGHFDIQRDRLVPRMRISLGFLHISEAMFFDISKVANLPVTWDEKGNSGILTIPGKTPLYSEIAFRGAEIMGYVAHPLSVNYVVAGVCSEIRQKQPDRMHHVSGLEREFEGMQRLLLIGRCAKWFIGVELMRDKGILGALSSLDSTGFETVYTNLDLHDRLATKIPLVLLLAKNALSRAEIIANVMGLMCSLRDKDFSRTFENLSKSAIARREKQLEKQKKLAEALANSQVKN